MSASRTLARRHLMAGMERDIDGKLVKKSTAKPASRNRRVISETYHATKGPRGVRKH